MNQQIFQALDNLIHNPKKSTLQFDYLLNKEPNFFQILLEIIQNQQLSQSFTEIALVIFNRSIIKALSYEKLSQPKFLLQINSYWNTFKKLLNSQHISFIQKRKLSTSFSQLIFHININEIKELLKQKRSIKTNVQQIRQIQFVCMVMQSIQDSKIRQDLKYQILLTNLTFLTEKLNQCISLLKSKIQSQANLMHQLFKHLANIQYQYQVLLKVLTFIIQYQNQQQQQENIINYDFQGTKTIMTDLSLSNLIQKGIHINIQLYIPLSFNCKIISTFNQKNIDKMLKSIKSDSIKIMALICKNLSEEYKFCESPCSIISGIQILVQELLGQLYNFTLAFPKIEQNIVIWKQNTNLISQIFQFLSQCSKFLQLRNMFYNLSYEFIFIVGLCNMNLQSTLYDDFQQQDFDQKLFFQNCLKQYDSFDLSISIGKWLTQMCKRIDGIQTFCFKICIQLVLQIIITTPIMNSSQILASNNIKSNLKFQTSLLNYLNILVKLTKNNNPNQSVHFFINELLNKINLRALYSIEICSFFLFLKNIAVLAFKNDQNLTKNILRFADLALSKQISISIYCHLVFVQNLMLHLCQMLYKQQRYNKRQQLTIIFLGLFEKLLQNLFTQSIYIIELLQTILNHHYLKNLENIQTIITKVYCQCINRLISEINKNEQGDLQMIIKIQNFLEFILQFLLHIDWNSQIQRKQTNERAIVASIQKFCNSILETSRKMQQIIKDQILQFLNSFSSNLQYLNKWYTIQNGCLCNLMIGVLFQIKTKLVSEYYLTLSKVFNFRKGVCLQSQELDTIINDSVFALQEQKEQLLDSCLSFIIYLYFFFIQYKFKFQKWHQIYQSINSLVIKCSAFQSKINLQIKTKTFAFYLISYRQNYRQKRIEHLLSFIQNNIKSIKTQNIIIYLYGLNYSKQQIQFEIVLMMLSILVQQFDRPSKPQIISYPFSNISPYDQANQIWNYLNQKNDWIQGNQFKNTLQLTKNKISAFRNKILINGQPRTLLKIKKNVILKQGKELQI